MKGSLSVLVWTSAGAVAVYFAGTDERAFRALVASGFFVVIVALVGITERLSRLAEEASAARLAREEAEAPAITARIMRQINDTLDKDNKEEPDA